MNNTLFALLVSSLLSFSVNATTFSFSETINRDHITGTFTGTVDNTNSNLIDNITSLEYIDQTAGSSKVVLSSANDVTQTIDYYITDPTHLSFDGTDNNLNFEDPYSSRWFASYTGINSVLIQSTVFPELAIVAFDPTPLNYNGIIVDNYPNQNIFWQVTESTPVPVSEPEIYTIFAVGLLGLGLVRKKAFHAKHRISPARPWRQL